MTFVSSFMNVAIVVVAKVTSALYSLAAYLSRRTSHHFRMTEAAFPDALAMSPHQCRYSRPTWRQPCVSFLMNDMADLSCFTMSSPCLATATFKSIFSPLIVFIPLSMRAIG